MNKCIPSYEACYQDLNGVPVTNDGAIKCHSKWKLQYPSSDSDVLSYWGGAKDSIIDCFAPDEFDNSIEIGRACCYSSELDTTNGKETFGQYAKIKVLDKQNNCLNC